MKTALYWFGVVSGLLVIVSGWDGLAHFPEAFMGDAAESFWENGLVVLWSRWGFPVPVAMWLIVVVTVLVAWVTRNVSKASSMFSTAVAVVALVTVLLPITFWHHSGTGTYWLRMPKTYWIWLILYGSICLACYSCFIVSDARANKNRDEAR